MIKTSQSMTGMMDMTRSIKPDYLQSYLRKFCDEGGATNKRSERLGRYFYLNPVRKAGTLHRPTAGGKKSKCASSHVQSPQAIRTPALARYVRTIVSCG
jgi:hypothetical protein